MDGKRTQSTDPIRVTWHQPKRKLSHKFVIILYRYMHAFGLFHYRNSTVSRICGLLGQMWIFGGVFHFKSELTAKKVLTFIWGLRFQKRRPSNWRDPGAIDCPIRSQIETALLQNWKQKWRKKIRIFIYNLQRVNVIHHVVLLCI